MCLCVCVLLSDFCFVFVSLAAMDTLSFVYHPVDHYPLLSIQQKKLTINMLLNKSRGCSAATKEYLPRLIAGCESEREYKNAPSARRPTGRNLFK